MKHIGNLRYAEGAKHKDKRIGRGPGSGHGGTATRGHKGAQSRRNYKTKIGFEGGQMPLHRRLPKFGFFNPFRVEYQVVNVSSLQELFDNGLLPDKIVNFEVLYGLNVINKLNQPLKILGEGELKTALTVEAHNFSASAKEKIESAGGAVKVNE
jgi:large subunit ribosomal protein L15